MALQVWLPLNKQNDARNQGLSNAVASNLSYSAYGKLGGCYTANGTICNWGSGHTSNGVTVAFWHKWQGAVPTGWVTTLQFPYSDGDRRYYLATNNGHFYPAYREAGYETKFTLDDKWHHITMAVSDDGTSLSIYIDGILDGAITGRSGFQLGGDLYMGQCYINDLRIYDHCLSSKEVKEISKGLVLHYPLNDAYAEGTTNIASNLSPSQIGGWQKMTITKLSTNNYHLKHQTSDSANLSYWSTFVYTLPSEYSNKTISFSARIKNIVYNDIKDSSWLYIGPGNNGQYPTHGSAMFYCYELKENQLISWTGVLSNSNRYVLVELWNDANSTSGSIEFDLVNIQIEEKDHVTPYTPNTRNETTVHDCSGYQNNGTASESLPYVLDSPRYKGCYYFNSTSKRITLPTINMTGFSNSFSISWWGKVPSYSAIMYWGFSNGNRLNYYSGLYCNTGDGGSNPYYIPNTTTVITSPSVNEWHHFVMVGNGSSNKLYMDGELYGIAKTYKNITGNTIVINGWDSGTYYKTNGHISDFRIYSTALSADDIKELYNTSCIINS